MQKLAQKDAVQQQQPLSNCTPQAGRSIIRGSGTALHGVLDPQLASPRWMEALQWPYDASSADECPS